MTTIRWTRGEVLDISGDLYRIVSRSKGGKVNLHHERDHRIEAKTDEELASLWLRGELIRLPDPDGRMKAEHRKMLEQQYTALPDHVRAEAEYRKPYVDAYVRSRLRVRSARALKPLIDLVAQANGHARKPSPRQLSRWLSRYFEVGSPDLRDIRCIAPRVHLRGHRRNHFSPSVLEIAWELIDAAVMKKPSDTAEKIFDDLLERVDTIDPTGAPGRFVVPYGERKGKLKCPSVRTIQRMLREVPNDVIIYGREGALAAEAKCKPVEGPPRTLKPLEQVEIDHHLLDVMVVDHERKTVLGRPWMTVALDRRTRAIVGHIITFQAPSAYTVMRCLRNAILPKDELLAQYPGIGRWPCFGKIEEVVVDNGMDLHSRSFIDACLQLGANVRYCPALRRSRATRERLSASSGRSSGSWCTRFPAPPSLIRLSAASTGRRRRPALRWRSSSSPS
jgi:putative transposase